MREIEVKTLLSVGLLAICSALLSGCLGAVLTKSAESEGTGKRYSELMASATGAPSGKGRLFVYRTSASTRHGLALNYGITTNEFPCVVDKGAYLLMTEAYLELELDPGAHEVSCHDVLFRKGFPPKFVYRKGTEVLTVAISPAEDTYVRIDEVNGKETPVAVGQVAALQEIAGSRVMIVGCNLSTKSPCQIE